jgi:hypothetical protein
VIKRLALSIILIPGLAMAQSFVATVQTPIPMVTVQLTAVPTALATPQFVVTPTNRAMRTITVDNTSGSAEVQCAYGGSATAHFSVPAGTVFTDNFGDRGFVSAASLACNNPTANVASTGSIKIYGSR